MPIKFRCHHCGQLLGIARRKAGTLVTCPRCKKAVPVPMEDESEIGRGGAGLLLFESQDFERWIGQPLSTVSKPTASATEPPPILPSAAPSRPAPTGDGSLSPLSAALTERIQFVDERRVALVVAVLAALVAFLVGLALGRYVVPSAPSAATTVIDPLPAKGRDHGPPAAVDPKGDLAVAAAVQEGAAIPLTGTILYRHDSVERPDAGGVVLVLPTDQKPDKKIDPLGLRPQDRHLQHRPGVEQLRRIGGCVGYVDEKGSFTVRVPRPGQCYILVLSQGARRDAEQAVFPDEAAILRRYFADLEGLLGGKDFLLITRDVQPDKTQTVRHAF